MRYNESPPTVSAGMHDLVDESKTDVAARHCLEENHRPETTQHQLEVGPAEEVRTIQDFEMLDRPDDCLEPNLELSRSLGRRGMTLTG